MSTREQEEPSAPTLCRFCQCHLMGANTEHALDCRMRALYAHFADLVCSDDEPPLDL
jgi:hypothetical protein